MPLKLDNIKQQGLTLVEVLGALVILALLSTSIMMMFTTSGVWIAHAGKQTIAGDYATSLVEVIKSYSSDLVELPPDFEVIDTNNSDQLFRFVLASGKPAIQMQAPPGMGAIIRIVRYDDTACYDSNGDGNKDINIKFNDNLFQVIVTINWVEAGRDKTLQMVTIVGAR
ncbi:MAG: prepilin-type N-terminal cleavage/methylation domain-containing protein [Syntrophomonas sp.]